MSAHIKPKHILANLMPWGLTPTLMATTLGLSPMRRDTQMNIAELDYAQFGPYAPTFQAMIPALMDTASKHDEAVDRLHVKEGEISDDIKESARLRNREGNKRVSTINDQIAKAQEKINELMAEAYDLVKNDLPTPLTEEEVPAVQEQVKNLRTTYKTQINAINSVAAMANLTEIVNELDLPTIKENGRRTGGTGGSGHTGKRLRFKEVYINGELASAKSTNDPTKQVSNFSVVANKLRSELKTQNIGASILQEQYYAAAKTDEVAKIPNDFVFTFTYRDGDFVKEYEIRAVRS